MNFPVALELWHRCGGRIAFDIGNVHFTQFDAADADALFEIRNHPTVIPFMPGASTIPYARHCAWVDATLLAQGPATPLIMVGRSAGRAIGFGLLKPSAEAGTLELGVIIAGAGQRSSLAPRLGVALVALAAHLFGADTLISYVNAQHEHALRLNTGGGLQRAETSDKPGELFFRTPIGSITATALYRRWSRGLRFSVTG